MTHYLKYFQAANGLKKLFKSNQNVLPRAVRFGQKKFVAWYCRLYSVMLGEFALVDQSSQKMFVAWNCFNLLCSFHLFCSCCFNQVKKFLVCFVNLFNLLCCFELGRLVEPPVGAFSWGQHRRCSCKWSFRLHLLALQSGHWYVGEGMSNCSPRWIWRWRLWWSGREKVFVHRLYFMLAFQFPNSFLGDDDRKRMVGWKFWHRGGNLW